MSDQTSLKVTKTRRKKRLRRGVITLLLSLIILYNLVTSNWFLVNFLFPFLGNQMGFLLYAESIELSLIEQKLEIQELYFGPSYEPIITANELTLDFDLFALLSGKIELDNVKLTEANIHIIRSRTGEYNVYPAEPLNSPKLTNESSIGPFEPKRLQFPQVNVPKIALKNSNFIYRYTDNHGHIDIEVIIKNFALNIDNLTNDGIAKLMIVGDSKIQADTLNLQDSELKLSGIFKLTEQLMPERGDAELEINNMRGSAGEVDLGGRSLHGVGSANGENVFNAMVVDFVNFELLKDGICTTRIETAADMTFYPWELKGKSNFLPLDEEISGYLNCLFTLPVGNIHLNGRNQVYLTDDLLNITGNAYASGNRGDLPKIESSSKFNMEWDLNSYDYTSNRFSSDFSIGERATGNITIASPFTLSYDEEDNFILAGNPPKIELTANHFNLKNLLTYASIPAQFTTAGELNARLTGTPSNDLNSLAIKGWCGIEELGIDFNGNQCNNLNATLSMDSTLYDHGIIDFEQLNAVFSASIGQLLVLNLDHSYINFFTGETQLNAYGSAIKEDGVNFLPIKELDGFKDWLKELPDSIRPLELTAGLPITYNPNWDKLSLGNADCRLYSNQRELLRVDIAANEFSLSNYRLENGLEAKVALEPFSLSAVDVVLDNLGIPVELRTGTIEGDAQIAISQNFRDFTIDFKPYLKNVTPKYGNLELSNLNLSTKLTAQTDLKHLTINAENLTIEQEGKQQLDLDVTTSFPINKLPIKEDIAVDLQINSVTGKLLKELKIPLPVQTNARGTALLQFDHQQKFSFASNFTVMEFPSKTPIECQGNIELISSSEQIKIKEAKLIFTTPENTIAEGIIMGDIPHNVGIDDPAFINFSVPILDAKTVFHCLSSVDTPKIESPDIPTDDIITESNEAPLCFSPFPAHINFNCDGISWGEDIAANLRGNIDITSDTFTLNRMTVWFNGTELRANADMKSGKTSTQYRIYAETDDAELSAILAPFIDSNYEDFYALISKANLNISGDSIYGNRFWDTQTGSLSINFAKIELPHTLGNTIIGRVVLLPFSVLLNVQDFIPTNLNQLEEMIQLTALFKRFYNNTEYFEFNSGKLLLTNQHGKVNVDHFKLEGAPVDELSFSGDFNIGSSHELNLESMVELFNIMVPVGIKGSWEEPKMVYSSMVTSGVKYNVNKFLRFSNPLNLLPKSSVPPNQPTL